MENRLATLRLLSGLTMYIGARRRRWPQLGADRLPRGGRIDVQRGAMAGVNGVQGVGVGGAGSEQLGGGRVGQVLAPA